MIKEPVNIWNEKYIIEKKRRAKLRETMDEYDNTVYYPAKESLYKLCEEETGHNWNFDGLNLFGGSMFYCLNCGKSKIDYSDLDEK